MICFRRILFAGFSCLSLGLAAIAVAGDDNVPSADFEKAASFMRNLVRAEDEVNGLLAKMVETDDVAERRRYEVAAREVDDALNGAVESTEVASLINALLSEPDVDRFAALLADLSPSTLSWLLMQSVEADLEFRQRHIPLALALLEDERDRIALSPPGTQRLMELKVAGFKEMGLEHSPAPMASLVWQPVLRMLPLRERTEVVRDAFSGAGFDLIASPLRQAVQKGELNDMALDFEPEWLLEKIQEDANHWQPLLLQANLGSGDDRLGNHFEAMPEIQQIRLLANNPDYALEHHFERLGEWVLAQDSETLGRQADSVYYGIIMAALDMDTPSSVAWLDAHLMDLPLDEIALDVLVDQFARRNGKTDIPVGLQLRLNAKHGSLYASPEQWLAMHQQEPHRLAELVQQVLPEMAAEADAATYSDCGYEMALAYKRTLDQDYPVPELPMLPNGHIPCAAQVLQMAGQFDSLALLDWVIDSVISNEPARWDNLAHGMAQFESEALSERVLWRLQDTPAWDRLSLGAQRRLLAAEGES